MKHGSDTKQRLLEAANELLWTHSYGAVSVDQICEKAGVQKGSFYHFFPSKSELAVAALENCWQQHRPKLDEIFSPQLPALERIGGYCELIYESQREKHRKTGKVCGCPYGSIGSEQSTLDELIRVKSMEIFGRIGKYLTATLRDAQAEEVVGPGKPEVLAQQIHALIEGTMLQAKMQNNLELIRQLKPAVFRLLGARTMAATR